MIRPFPLYSRHLIWLLESKEWDLYDSNVSRVTEKNCHLDSLALQQLEVGIFVSMKTNILSVGINKAILVTYFIVRIYPTSFI